MTVLLKLVVRQDSHADNPCTANHTFPHRRADPDDQVDVLIQTCDQKMTGHGNSRLVKTTMSYNNVELLVVHVALLDNWAKCKPAIFL